MNLSKHPTVSFSGETSVKVTHLLFVHRSYCTVQWHCSHWFNIFNMCITLHQCTSAPHKSPKNNQFFSLNTCSSFRIKKNLFVLHWAMLYLSNPSLCLQSDFGTISEKQTPQWINSFCFYFSHCYQYKMNGHLTLMAIHGSKAKEWWGNTVCYHLQQLCSPKGHYCLQ